MPSLPVLPSQCSIGGKQPAVAEARGLQWVGLELKPTVGGTEFLKVYVQGLGGTTRASTK